MKVGGQDDPIWSSRREREGWQLKRRGEYRQSKANPRLWMEGVEKELRVKSLGAWTLEMQLAGIAETEGPWYVTEYRVVDDHGNVALDLGRTDWADWSHEIRAHRADPGGDAMGRAAGPRSVADN